MDNKITFDLELLQFALSKAIEILNNESKLVTTTFNVKPQDLDRLASEKEDVMNFIDWHIPIIVRYIKMHKGDLDDIQDISNLAIRANVINKSVQEEIQKNIKLPQKNTIGQQKVSSITLIESKPSQDRELIDILFVNDSDEMPKTITRLLKEVFVALEDNFNKLSSRKNLNEQIFNIVSKTIKEDQKVSYSPKRKKENLHGNLIYSEDC
jgi:hypothetical protein